MMGRHCLVVDGVEPARQNSVLPPDQMDLVNAFYEAAMKEGFDGTGQLITVADAVSTLRTLPAGQQILVLLLASAPDEIRRLPGFLQAIDAMRHRVVSSIALCSFTLSKADTLDCIIAGASAVIDWKPDRSELDEIARASSSGTPIFPEFRPPDQLSLRRAFIITPYPSQARPGVSDDLYGGMLPALKALDIVPVLAKNHVIDKNLQGGVRKHIETTDFSIVNVSTYGGAPNPNVYWEYGFAEGKGKDVIVVNDPSYAPPADFKGDIQAQYKTPAHLTQILYFGLKHLA